MIRILNKYKYFFLILVVTGCKKTLDLTPQDQISDASFWKTAGHFQLAANDFYYGLQEVPQYIDINSDIAFGAGANAVSNGSYLPSASSTVWDNSYTQIRAVNYLLEKAPGSNLGTAIDRWVGEALFFRAYYYNLMSQKYGDLPQSEALQGAAKTAPVYDSQHDIYVQILKWLDEANTELGAMVAAPGSISLPLTGDIYLGNDLFNQVGISAGLT